MNFILAPTPGVSNLPSNNSVPTSGQTGDQILNGSGNVTEHSTETVKVGFRNVLQAQQQGASPHNVSRLAVDFPPKDTALNPEGNLLTPATQCGIHTHQSIHALTPVISKQLATGLQPIQLQITEDKLVVSPLSTDSLMVEGEIEAEFESVLTLTEIPAESAQLSMQKAIQELMQENTQEGLPEQLDEEETVLIVMPSTAQNLQQKSGATEWVTPAATAKVNFTAPLNHPNDGVTETLMKADVKNPSPQLIEGADTKAVLNLDIAKSMNTLQVPAQNKPFGFALQQFSSLKLQTQPMLEKVATETAALEKVENLASQFNTGLQPGVTKMSADSARMQMPLTLQFGHAEWANQVAERSAMMSAQKIRVAEMQLDPPELGALQVRVTVNQDQQATVTFTSPHASVRDALDQTVARLREMLEEQGVDLVDVNVSDHPQAEEDDEPQFTNTHSPSQDTEVDDSGVTEHVNLISTYGVDYYA